MHSLLQKIFGLQDSEKYLKLYWWRKFHKSLDLNNPVGLDAKLQWLKIYYYREDYPALVDKATAKQAAAELIGQEHIIPTIGVWNKWEDIPWKDLPEEFVMKATHWGGGHNLAIRSKGHPLSERKARCKIMSTFRSNLYRRYREWPFKDIQPRIIAEKYMGANLTDYKFFCYNGKALFVMLCLDRFTDKKYLFFDRDFTYLRADKYSLTLPEDFTYEKPAGLDEMFQMADKLSQGMPFVRVDLYNIDGTIYFSEWTFFPCSGFDTTLTEEGERILGDPIVLPEKNAIL